MGLAGTPGGAIPERDGLTQVVRRIEQLERQQQQLAAANILQAAAIGEGGLSIFGGGSLEVIDPNSAPVGDPLGGNVVAYIGSSVIPDGSGRTQMVVFFTRDDGTPTLALADLGTIPGHTHQQALAWFDRTSNTVVADDTTSGQGLARPYIPIGTFTDNTVPTSTTTSTTWTTLQTLAGFKQHPKVTMQILAYSDTGTAGQLQVIDQAGNTVGGVQTIPSGTFGYINIGPVPLLGAHELAISLNIQAQVTSGAGKVGARGVMAVGVQS